MTPTAEAGSSRRSNRRLIARQPVLDHLCRLARAAGDVDRVTVALVEGPAGIGKTRVVHEVARALAEDEGFAVLVGHCVAQGARTLPFAPLVDLLADLVHREGVETVRRWSGPAGAELGRLVPALDPDGEASASRSAGTGRLFQSLAALLHHLADRSPLLLVIEDVHWIDTSTRELLDLLARQLRKPVLVLFTLRTDESSAPAGLTRYLAELVRHGDHRVMLAPLTREQQAHQIAAIRGIPPHPALLDEIYRRAEGNPFFAEELLALEDDHRDRLPVSVRDLLLARLEALPPATRQLLRTASLVGREVPHRLLEAVADVTGDRLEAALHEAVAAQVLEVRDGDLMFRHALLQEAVAASLLPGESARVHRRLATSLTERPELAGSGHRVAGRVARHWDAAGELPRALLASIAAGRESSDAFAFTEALAHYERALQLLAVVPDAETLIAVPRARLLRSVAEVAHLCAHPDRALTYVREALRCVDVDDAHLRGWLHERLGRYLWMAGDGQGALVAYQEAVALVPPEPPTRSRAAVLSGLSQILMLADRYEESERFAREAIAVATSVPDGRSVEGHARCNLGVDLTFNGSVEEGLEELRTASRIADEELDDPDENARALVNLSSALLAAGRWEEAAIVAERAVRVSDELGLQRRKGVWCRCDAAHLLALLGRLPRAAQLLEEARGLDPQGVDGFRTDLEEGHLRLRQGRLNEARALLERARAASTRLLDPQLLGPLYATLVEVAIWQDDDAAAPLHDEGVGRLDASPGHHAIFETELLAAGVRATVGSDTVTARGWYDRACRAHRASRLAAPRSEADIATAAAELDGGPVAWTAAAELWTGLGDRYRAAEAWLRATETALTTGADRSEAASYLRTSLTLAREVEAIHLLGRAEDLGRRSRLMIAEPTADNPYRLTGREREVLAAVVEGLTDRQVGTRLFISHRTVERHVSNLLAKLGAERRSELVATALREELLG